MPGTISAANGPRVRMRVRYQRGPSMSGADVMPPARAGVDPDLGDGAADGRDGARGGSEEVYESTTVTAYDVRRGEARHHPSRLDVSDFTVVLLTIAVVVSVWSGSIGVGMISGLVVGVISD